MPRMRTRAALAQILLRRATTVLYAFITMTTTVGDLSDNQKEWFSQSFLVGVAAAAGCPVELRLNDVFGVDATVHLGGVQTDWQLKGTSSPKFSADRSVLFFDLDVRTYNLFIGVRNASAYLGVVVMPPEPDNWLAHEDEHLLMRHCGYWQRISGMAPTTNDSKVRIHLPTNQRLCADDVQKIMSDERKRLIA